MNLKTNILKQEGTMDLIQKALKELLEDYQFPPEVLGRLCHLSPAFLQQYPSEAEIAAKQNRDIAFQTGNKLLMLQLLDKENPDKKIQAFLQVLIDYHQIPSQTIAKLAHLPEKTILNFKKNPILVTNLGEKYQIAYVVMVLRFLFKELEP